MFFHSAKRPSGFRVMITPPPATRPRKSCATAREESTRLGSTPQGLDKVIVFCIGAAARTPQPARSPGKPVLSPSATAAAKPGVPMSGLKRAKTPFTLLLLIGTEWKFEPIRNTRAAGDWHDNGPDIAVRGDNEIHILTPTGNY